MYASRKHPLELILFTVLVRLATPITWPKKKKILRIGRHEAAHIQLFRERLFNRSVRAFQCRKVVWEIFNKINSTCTERRESKMPRPFSEDLRWRAIWMKEFLGYSVDEVAVRTGLC